MLESLALARADHLCSVHLACGGCPLLGFTAEEQRAAKTERLRRLLTDAAVPWREPEWVSDGNHVGYRNRVRLRFDRGVPVFFNRNKLLDCAALRSDLQQALARVSAWAPAHQAGLERYAHLEVRAPDADGLAALQLNLPGMLSPVVAGSVGLSAGPQLPSPAGFVLAQPGGAAPVQRFVWSEAVYGYVPVCSFMQVNTGVNRRLIATVQALARSFGARTGLDLFCGSGAFALSWMALGMRVAAVEVDEVAMAAFERAAHEQSFTPERAMSATVVAAGAQLATEGASYDLVIANPPRAGLGDTAALCARFARSDFLLCCCKAESFARDSRALLDQGFELAALWAFDMFPGTQHVELLGHFSR